MNEGDEMGCGNHVSLWVLIGLLITLILGNYAYTAQAMNENQRQMMSMMQAITRLEAKQDAFMERFNSHLSDRLNQERTIR